MTDPWRAGVRTAQVHLYMNFFPINTQLSLSTCRGLVPGPSSHTKIWGCSNPIGFCICKICVCVLNLYLQLSDPWVGNLPIRKMIIFNLQKLSGILFWFSLCPLLPYRIFMTLYYINLFAHMSFSSKLWTPLRYISPQHLSPFLTNKR